MLPWSWLATCECIVGGSGGSALLCCAVLLVLLLGRSRGCGRLEFGSILLHCVREGYLSLRCDFVGGEISEGVAELDEVGVIIDGEGDLLIQFEQLSEDAVFADDLVHCARR